MTDFFPYFQPIVDLASGQIAGYEALARCHFENDVISAWPYLQKSQFSEQKIQEIDRDIRLKALTYHGKNPDMGFITLNILPEWVEQFSEQDWSEIPTLKMVKKLNIPTQHIMIEITESVGSIDKLRQVVTAYQQQGLKVAIDDFGAGASQIDRAIALKPDFIKLDMGLIKHGVHGGITADVALAINTVTQRAGCQIICEGVETEAEYHFAVECGADYIQGFIFHPALPQALPPETTTAQNLALKYSYLNRKVARVQAYSEHQSHIHRCIFELKNALNTSHQLDGLAASLIDEMRSIGVLRYYICNDKADQTSANYNLTEQDIIADLSMQAKNWAHRPYITALLGSKMHSMDIEVSNIYRDKATNQFCKTFCTMLTSSNVLLVDVAIDDYTLFSSKF